MRNYAEYASRLSVCYRPGHKVNTLFSKREDCILGMEGLFIAALPKGEGGLAATGLRENQGPANDGKTLQIRGRARQKQSTPSLIRPLPAPSPRMPCSAGGF